MEVGKEFLHYCTWPNLNNAFSFSEIIDVDMCIALVSPDIDICPGSKKYYISFWER